MDGSQIIRRALRVADECEAAVTVDVFDGENERTFEAPVRISYEDDQVLIQGVGLVDIECVTGVTFSRDD